LINRLTKLSFEDMHKAFIKFEKKDSQAKFERLYNEIDFFEDFHRSVLKTIIFRNS